MRQVLKGMLVWLAWMVMSVPVVLLVARALKARPDPPAPRERRVRPVDRGWLDPQGPRATPDRRDLPVRKVGEGPRVFPARQAHPDPRRPT